ncbi:MAG: class I SAM-dependent methyltransferase [Candidatus Eisenbacteria bacterium]
MDYRKYNADAWDRQVERGNPWTVAVSPERIAAARRGEWSIILTPTKPVPAEWFPPLGGAKVLGLASGGGQQGPILAAAGADVTVFDNSPRQLARDREVADREGLAIETVRGDMADLGAFGDDGFDLVVHPVSNCFAPRIDRVWREAFRVLRPGGALLAGFTNPVLYLVGEKECGEGRLVVRNRLPYADAADLDAGEREKLIAEGSPFEWSHSLTEQIGGQIEAGFVLRGFYEDRFPEGDALSEYTDVFIATRAVKPE